jgi:predicted lipoprotein with Yx(FWY)xxD motif
MKILTTIATLMLISNVLSADQYNSKNSTIPPHGKSQLMSGPTVKVANDPKLGKILTDSKGITLYIFTPDNSKTSTCYDQCADAWPPLLVTTGQPIANPEVTGKLDVMIRRDKTRQVTYNGMPLYYFAKDTKAGDTKGQKLENKWFVVNLDAKSTKNSK